MPERVMPSMSGGDSPAAMAFHQMLDSPARLLAAYSIHFAASEANDFGQVSGPVRHAASR